MRPITLKVDLNKIDEKHLFQAKSGARYLDLVAWPSRNSQYGDTHYVKQQMQKGHDGDTPIIGNMTIPEMAEAAPSQPDAPSDDHEEIPF